MSRLKILVLCGRSPRHWYVANALCQAAEVQAIVQETGAEWNAKKIWKLLRPDNFFRKVWRWVRDRRRYVGNRESEFFFGNRPAALDQPERVVEVPHVNDPAVVALADRLQPDLICVFGTSLIRGDLLTRGRLGMVNLHGGLSPEYRGADCTFWALYNQEPEKIGCTLHWIDVGIDTGRLVAHVSPAVQPDDDELSLFWRGVQDSAAVYAELAERLATGEQFGQQQPGRGRLYQVKQRGLRHELRVEKQLKDGMLRNLDLASRVRWFPAQEKVR